MKTFFFGDHLNLTEKPPQLILFKSYENLSQVRLGLDQTSKKAPPPLLPNPGYAPDS